VYEDYADDVSEGSALPFHSLCTRAQTCAGGYSGTAHSSPLAGPAYPDAEPDALHLSPAPEEDITAALAGAPRPAYPAPARPFSVLPPPKLAAGAAPPLVLDRTRAQVRRWRPVVREVRGVAGGRWFARCWLGEKESAFAAVAGPPPEPAYAPPKPRRGRGRGGALGSSGTSRAASAGPEGAASAPPRAPTKMRTSVVAPDIEIVSMA
jgi:hypothetical protein